MNERVLHLRSSDGFYGAEQVILNLVRELNTLGCPSHVACFNNTHNPHLELMHEVRRIGITASAVDCRGVFDRQTVRDLRQIITREQIDVVHCHDYKARVFGLCAAHGTKVNKVATNHLWTRTTLRDRVYEAIDGLLLNGFDTVVAVSIPIENECRAFMLRRERLTCIANGIDVRPFMLEHRELRRRSTRRELGLNDSDLVIGNVARLSLEKDQATLLRAFKMLVDASPRRSYRLLIVGDGPERRSLVNLSQHLGVRDVCLFAGVRTDIPQVLNCLDVYVQSSIREGLPMVILEAMATGTAIVSTKAGGIPHILTDREHGRLVEIGNAAQMARVLEDVLTDAAERNRLGQQAQRLVAAKFSARAMAKQYCDVYGRRGNSQYQPGGHFQT
jgi:glycosyltransferase involved in cell wall biosynthesis